MVVMHVKRLQKCGACVRWSLFTFDQTVKSLFKLCVLLSLGTTGCDGAIDLRHRNHPDSDWDQNGYCESSTSNPSVRPRHGNRAYRSLSNVSTWGVDVQTHDRMPYSVDGYIA